MHATSRNAFFALNRALVLLAYSYKTITAPSAGLYKEKGSKFLAFAYPVESEQAIKEKIEGLKKEYFDARHHCFAWVLGADRKAFRAFDDGEPNHSAGDPILGQIRSRDLSNVLVVVVRYFGGVKLGVGGLVSAYKIAAAAALDEAEVVEKELVERVRITYPYDLTGDAMRLVKEFDLTILRQDFLEICLLEVQVSLRSKEGFLERVALMNAMGKAIALC